MTSIFTREEIGSLHPLTDEAACRAADIRGPFRKWRLSGSVSCGAFTSINGALNARGTVRIGRYCAFGQDLSLVSGNHRLDMPNTQMWLARRHGFAVPTETKGPIEIGHNVWIGDKVIVLSGVTVGHGAVIGAGAVVTKPVAPFQIVGGSPARPIRTRFTPGVVAQLLDIAWWNWPEDRIGRNRVFFETHIAPDRDVDLIRLVVP